MPSEQRVHGPSAPQDAIWEHFQTAGRESFAGARPRLERLLGLLPGPCRVLNIGIGDGAFEALALRAGHQVHSLDPSEAAVEALRGRLDLGDRAAAGRMEAMPFAAAAFDAVVASEVLEHLDDDALEQALAEVRRVLRPGGVFLGTVPRREDLAAQYTVCPCCGQGFHRWGHAQSFSEDRLAALLARRFEQVRVRAALFVAWERLNWAGRLAAGLKRCLLAAGRHGSGENLLFQAVRPGPGPGSGA